MPGGSAQNEQGGPQRPAPDSRSLGSRSGVEHGDDLKGSRIYHHDLVADEEKFITSPIRIVRHDFGRQGVEADLAWNAGPDRDREVDVGSRRDVLIADHGRDLGALFGGELGTRASLSDGLRTFFLLRAGSVVVVATLGLHVAFALVFGLHVLAGRALFILRHALGVVGLGVLFGVLGRFLAHRLFTRGAGLHVLLGALILHAALFLGLGRLHPFRRTFTAGCTSRRRSGRRRRGALLHACAAGGPALAAAP